MFKYILESAGDINWMAIFALLTFFTVFGVSLYVIFRRDKDFIDHMANLPLEEEAPQPNGRAAVN
ncbi:MAG: hypothetical protein KDC43_03140 [Saprospiraceae bacterium]|nr:hypothetical protein [Saprospiraceae bacterium]MCB0622929.1 hypothetical protein [Saprospiraceae bacterium]MCB0677184.1 hypothetical protein [Saprospiraceae bacterium]MCB0680199.1 hypothetical protein [Saprospiraceae bacterium]